MTPTASELPRPRTKPLNVVSAILGECLCDPFPLHERGGLTSGSQFIELRGIEYIGLGAVIDELSAKERIQETVDQLLMPQTKRLISMGYLIDDDSGKQEKITQTVPLDVWVKSYPNDKTMNKQLQRTITAIKNKEFGVALQDLTKTYEQQKYHPQRGINKYLLGITAHNIGVIHLILHQDDKAISMFQQAVIAKRVSFGADHLEVALSLDEVGIQLFAIERFQEALHAFVEAKKIRVNSVGVSHPSVAMVLNNIACCNFLLGNHVAALANFCEASDIHKQLVGSSAREELDLLHVAITLCNMGYMQIRLKQYEVARGVFEEALMIQQSVYGDEENIAIKNTLSNMDFTNAFHS